MRVSFKLKFLFLTLVMLAVCFCGFSMKNISASADSTPVSEHGRLSVKGSQIVDKNGNAFQLIGMSTHGLAWYPEAVSEQTMKTLRDDWNCNAFRLAMYTEEYGGYTTSAENKNAMISRIDNGVNIAKKLGMYVIIDWHILNDNNPQTHKSEAIDFFKKMSAKYKGCANVIYEICNEPHWVSWASDIKPYCVDVIKAIRNNDPNGIIICGSNTWSQDIHEVLQNPITGYKNIAYSLHFYANTHTQWLRDRLADCLDRGLCVVVTEFGTCDASGNGGFNKAETDSWMTLLQNRKVGLFNWSLSNKSETASAILPGVNLSAIKPGESQLTQSGKLIRSWTRRLGRRTGQVTISYANTTNNAVRIVTSRSDADGYKVWISASKSFPSGSTRLAKTYSNSQTTVRFDNLANRGGTYYVKVQGYKGYTENGKRLYVYSTPVVKTIKLAPAIAANKLKSASTTNNSVKLNIQKNNSADGYKVWICADKSFKEGASRLIRTSSNSAVNFSFAGLTRPGKSYYIKVQTYKWHNNGIRNQAVYSNPVIKKITLSPKVANNKISSAYVTGNSADISIVRNTSADGYKVWICADKSFKEGASRLIRTSSNSAVNFSFAGLTRPGKSYYVKVQTYKWHNNGITTQAVYSTPVVKTINLAPVIAENKVSSLSVNGNSVNIKILRNSSADGYKVWICADKSFKEGTARLIRTSSNSELSFSFENLAYSDHTYYIKLQTYKWHNNGISTQAVYSEPIITTVKTDPSDVYELAA